MADKKQTEPPQPSGPYQEPRESQDPDHRDAGQRLADAANEQAEQEQESSG